MAQKYFCMLLTKVLPNITHILSENKVDIMFAHQAGKIVLDGIIKKISKEIYLPTNYDRFGNLVSSSIPFLLRIILIN